MLVSARVLEDLKSDEFELSVGFLSTASALRRFLNRTPAVAAVRQALRQGAITEDTIRQFVSVVISDLRIGQRLPYEIAIAGLAVVLESRATDFAEEYLHDLSRLRLAEMSLCIRVARECLKHRVNIARRESRVLRLASDEECVFSVVTTQSSFPDNGERLQDNGDRLQNTTATCKVA
jgi:hypothetical protein